METAMSLDAEEMIQLLLKTNKEQEQTITDLRATIKDLRSTIANLNETLDELKRKLFGSTHTRIINKLNCRIRLSRACGHVDKKKTILVFVFNVSFNDVVHNGTHSFYFLAFIS